MSNQPLIIAHRGASAVAPENTLASFSRALKDQADGIEFDVRLSRDQVPVVIHDASLARTGLVKRFVRDLTAEELQKIDVGGWFDQFVPTANTSYAGQRVPTLRQLFQSVIETNAVLYLEMKCAETDRVRLATEVVRLVQESHISSRVIVESFDLAAIVEVKSLEPAIRTAALFEPKLLRRLSTVARKKLVDLAAQSGADELALHHTLVSSHIIERAKELGLATIVWTVENPEWIQRARSLGIKALVTDNPATMVYHRLSLPAN